MNFCIVTLFPEIMAALHAGIIGKAIQQKLLEIQCVNPRDYTADKHRSVDDAPYGGGPGLVMMAPPLDLALQRARAHIPGAKVVYLSPQGRRFNQALAITAAQAPGWIFLAGRYEGIDQRIIERHVDEEWSIGDYVISGGEFAALVVIDAIARCIPKVVGDAASITEDSFYKGMLKHPQYTRPGNYLGQQVPKVLLQGDHEKIARWRRQHSLAATWLKRPDLLEKKVLSAEEKQWLHQFIEEYERKHDE